ncbi:MAG: glycoside hydrolase family 38 C-terminal domain-containing protein, partial [Victivallales bacterium]|nr:glycoside hydrolase family 38 C-terminal domain-containing protein [Victivallales bacterium]
MTKTLHLIANSHLDPVWLWRWQEGLNEIIPTCRTVLELLDEYPELKYTRGESSVYEHLQLHDPDTFKRIKAMVKRGRWEIVGGWYNQPDTVLSDGESLFRQAFYGQEYFAREFGFRTDIAYLVDSFGQAGSLPQILRKTGFRFFVFHRPRQDEMKLPSPLFRWQSRDGSEIIALRLIGAYANERGMLREKIELNIKEMPAQLNDWAVLFGLGDHGGGLNRNDLEQVFGLREELKKDGIALVFSTLADFFSRVSPAAAGLPVVKGELLYHGRGCLSANSGIKRQTWNLRKALYEADFAQALATAASEPEPDDAAVMEKAWKALLFNQFHDVICGTCSPEASEDSEKQLAGGIFSSEEETNRSLLKLAAHLNTEGDGQAVIAVNPHPWKIRAVLPVEFLLDYRPLKKMPEAYTVTDCSGKPVPCQEIPFTSVTGALPWRKKVLFCGELPPCGVGVFHLTHGKSPAVRNDGQIKIEADSAANEQLGITLNKESGGIILRNRTGVLSAGELMVFEDYSDAWAHGVDKFENYRGHFEFQRFEWIETGPVRAVMRITSKYRQSTFVQNFTIFADRSAVWCQAELDWREKHAVAKLSFSTGETIKTITALRLASWETPDLNSGELPNGILLHAADKQAAGFCISCPEKGAYDVKAEKLCLTVARSSIYAWYWAPLPQTPGYHEYLDLGRQKFSYTVIGPENSFNPEWLHAAYENSMPPVTMLTYPHQGKLGKSYSLFAIDQPGLVLWTAQQNKKGQGMIFRFWNSRSEKTDYKITFSDNQVKTLSVRPEETVTVLWIKNNEVNHCST